VKLAVDLSAKKTTPKGLMRFAESVASQLGKLLRRIPAAHDLAWASIHVVSLSGHSFTMRLRPVRERDRVA